MCTCTNLNFVSYYLGHIQSRNEEADILLGKIIVPLLQLGSDMDGLICELFFVLLMQIMHWYSNSKQNSLNVDIILNALMVSEAKADIDFRTFHFSYFQDGTTHPTNSSLRDLSGLCIKEFIFWAKRQQGKGKSLNKFEHTTTIVKNIRCFSLHPDPYKRLGAAIIFNNIHTILREDEESINLYWLELLQVFILNLSLAVDNFDDSNCVTQTNYALNHLSRVFVEKADLFNKPSRDRITPHRFDGNLLSHVAKWLLKYCGSTNPNCRKKSIELFNKIAPLVEDCCTRKRFVEKHLERSWFAQIYAHGLEVHDSGFARKEDLLNWLNNLWRILDGYLFAVKIDSSSVDVTDSFVVALHFFIDSVHLKNLHDLFPEDSATLFEKENYNYIKSSVVLSAIELSRVLLEHAKEPVKLRKYFDKTFWKFICNSLFVNNEIVFYLAKDNFFDKISEVLGDVPADLYELSKNDFMEVALNYDVHDELTRNVCFTNITASRELILKNILLLQKTPFADCLGISAYSNNIVHNILSAVDSDAGNKRTVDHLNLKLKIALNYSKNEELLKILIEEQNLMSKHGKVILKTYMNAFMNFFVDNFEKCFRYFLTSSDNNFEDCYSYVTEVLNYLLSNKGSLTEKIEEILNVILSDWHLLAPYFNDDNKHITMGIHLFKQIVSFNVRQEQFHLVSDWIFAILYHEDRCDEGTINFISEVFELFPYIFKNRSYHDER